MIVVKLTRTRLVLAICTLVVGVAACASYAAIPSANGTISACVKQNGEIQKLVDTEAGEACAGNNKHLVTWNQQGPTGPQGMPGISAYQIVEGTSAVSDTFDKERSVSCPAGTKPLGGGANAFRLTAAGSVITYWNATFVANMVNSNGSGWFVLARKLDATASDAWGIKVYVVCANVASCMTLDRGRAALGSPSRVRRFRAARARAAR